MFKPKRKEKPKRGNNLSTLISLIVLLLLVVGGAAGYWFLALQSEADKTIAAEPSIGFVGSEGVMAGSSACSYSQGFGSRENSEMASQIETALRNADTDIITVTVEENLSEYRTCGDMVEPIYQTCSLLTISLPVQSDDPSERELGEHIAEILDVLTTENICTPVELSVVFETTRGSITWQMSYALAMEAYEDGARGVELYDPSARR